MSDSFPWLPSYPAGVDWRKQIAPQPVHALLNEAKERYGNKKALDFFGRITTYQELYAQVKKCAGALQMLGVTNGTRVGIFMPNCPQCVISYYAILMAGGVVVNYNPLYAPNEIVHQIEDSATEIIITVALTALYPKVAACVGAGQLRMLVVSEFQEALPLAKRMGFTWMKAKEIAEVHYDAQRLSFANLLEKNYPFSPVAIDAEKDIAVLQYTGGTTGIPKGCVLTHANVYSNAVQCGMWFSGLEYGKETMVGALPFFHVFAMTAVMNLAVHTGMCLLLYPRFDLKQIVQDITTKKPTLMAGVPTMFTAINNYRSLDKYDLTSLKMCISGGSSLPSETRQRFEALAGCTLVEGYGLSESSPVLCANPLFGINKDSSIGLPFPGTQVRIVNPETGKVMPEGEMGEICAKGPQVMRGYLERPEETACVIKEGFLHTGDLGYMDADGYVFVVDRLKEMIISGGYNIYPRHLEDALYKHPAVLEAAAIGVPHPSRGQEVKVFIVPKEGIKLEKAQVMEHLRAHISAYALPHTVVFRDSLPKSAIGKILKKMLVEEEISKG